MNQTPDETLAYVSVIAQHNKENLQLWVIPSYTNIAAVANLCAAHGIWLGAQNMHWENDGAYTGEISARQLKSVGANLVMLGHAERRTLFGETDEQIRKKVLAARQHGLRVLLCVGETALAKATGSGFEYVAQQLAVALQGLPECAEPDALMILYEPVWSIGVQGTPAAPSEVSAAFAHIRQVLSQLFGTRAQAIPILYGGSVNTENCAHYAQLPNCVGLGVGRAALRAESFIDILNRSLLSKPIVPHRTQSDDHLA